MGKELVTTGLGLCKPRSGWSSIVVPDKETLITDAGKLFVLDSLLTRLKAEGHRVLIYSQMTKMIDLLEVRLMLVYIARIPSNPFIFFKEYMWHRKHRYMRLDGSSKISARRDMVADFQSRADIFVFLLSTRAGGLGINLTAADTVSSRFLPIREGIKKSGAHVNSMSNDPVQEVNEWADIRNTDGRSKKNGQYIMLSSIPSQEIFQISSDRFVM